MLQPKKKRILIVVPRIPYPLNSGGRIAIYDTIKLLANKYFITLVIVDDRPENKVYLNHFEELSDDVHFITKPKPIFLLNAILGYFKGRPLQVGYFYFREAQKLIDSLALKCDIYFSFMIRTTTYGLNLNLKKIHYAIDSMYLNYKKSQEKTTSLLWRLIYKIEIPRLYQAELKQIQEYDLTTFVNKEEAEFWVDKGNVKTLPHGINSSVLNYKRKSNKYSNVVAFIGRMDYQPNIEAVLWFCNNVIGLLDENIKFYIIGGFATPQVEELANIYNNVKVLGFVEDPNLILRSCICTVAPMQTGGGLQTKILLAMALESIVITTPSSTNAIVDAEDKVNIFVEEKGECYSKLINDLYLNPNKYLSIKSAAKKVIEKNYTIEGIENKLFSFVDSI